MVCFLLFSISVNNLTQSIFTLRKKLKKKNKTLSGMIINHQYQKCGIITKMVISIFNFKFIEMLSVQ